MTAWHAPDAGGQLQPLVRQPQAPRNETARPARRLGRELARPEARRAAAQREAMRTRRRGSSPRAAADDPRVQPRPAPEANAAHPAAPGDLASGRPLRTKWLAAPRRRCPATEPRCPHGTPRRGARGPAERRKPTEGGCARSRTPCTRAAGLRTANGREDPACYATDPTSRIFFDWRETLRGCLTDRRSAASAADRLR
jgi:hypothetical protein